MLAPAQQTYTKPYRDKKTFAPSGFIMYVGISKKLENLKHHNLYFNEDWAKSFGEIFEKKILPEDPSLYMCVPSKTDDSVAPEGMENMFVLVPIPNGIEITPEQREAYREKIRDYIENMAGECIRDHLVYEKIFDVHDFAQRYHAWNGNAIGLAHSIMQTACFRPNNYSKKLDNLFYVGHTTNPGCGVPMVIISGMLVVERVEKRWERKNK
jgi:phytoene desaturase